MIAVLLLVASMASAASAKGRVLDLPVIRAFVPFLAPSRYKGAHGGRGSAKSHEFAKNVLKFCLERRGSRVACLREIQLSLKQSVKFLLEEKIKEFGLTAEFPIAATEIGTPGGGVILFQGLQDHTADSIKSLEGIDLAWVEEAQSISERSLRLLRPTIRKERSEIWFTWNPELPTDPVDELLRGPEPPPDSIVVEVSYRDNPFFPDVLRAEMEYDRRRDPDKYAHVWLGKYNKKSEARVFRNWRIEDIEPPPNTIFYQGGDWGYSVDPTVLIRCWELDARTLVIDAERYRIGCEIDDTPAFFDGLECGCDPLSPAPCRRPELHATARAWTTLADSARPETISHMNRHGYPLIGPAVKGAGSVKDGVIFLQSYDIIARPRCPHTIDELSNYSYVVDKKTGLVTPILEDKKNHVIDSLRYSVEKLREARNEDWLVA